MVSGAITVGPLQATLSLSLSLSLDDAKKKSPSALRRRLPLSGVFLDPSPLLPQRNYRVSMTAHGTEKKKAPSGTAR